MFIHDVKYAGTTVQDKYAKVEAKLENKVDALLVTSLDDIAWLLNLRGLDIKCNPVIFAYLIFFPKSESPQESTTRLFIDAVKVSDEEVATHLRENRVEIAEYNSITDALSELVAQNKRIGYDETVCNQRLYELFQSTNP